jgi:hypothetical protein
MDCPHRSQQGLLTNRCGSTEIANARWSVASYLLEPSNNLLIAMDFSLWQRCRPVRLSLRTVLARQSARLLYFGASRSRPQKFRRHPRSV